MPIQIQFAGETIVLSCDFSQATSQLLVDGSPIGLQVADARHRRPLAVALACAYAWPEERWPNVPREGHVEHDWPGDGRTDAWDEMSYWDMP